MKKSLKEHKVIHLLPLIRPPNPRCMGPPAASGTRQFCTNRVLVKPPPGASPAAHELLRYVVLIHIEVTYGYY